MLRQNAADVMGNRLENDSSDLVRVAFDRCLNVPEAIKSTNQRILDCLMQHARGAWIPFVDKLRLADHVAQHVVVPTVIAALKLDDLAPAGHRARQPDRVKGRLRASATQ